MALDADTLRSQIACGIEAVGHNESQGASVLVPLLDAPLGPEVLFEVRATTLATQPGEVALPGGTIEPGEDPAQAAVRETCEELLVEPSQIQVVGSLGNPGGPGNAPFHAFVGVLSSYEDTFSKAEVERTFHVPLAYFLEHDPTCYVARTKTIPPNDLPFDRIPGGRAYPWHVGRHEIPFYLDVDPVIWGATARVMYRLSEVLRAGGAASRAVPLVGTDSLLISTPSCSRSQIFRARPHP